MRSKRIVVTGGAGFLGSHLCDRLLDAGAEVVCLDNFFTGSKSNVAHLLSNPQFPATQGKREIPRAAVHRAAAFRRPAQVPDPARAQEAQGTAQEGSEEARGSAAAHAQAARAAGRLAGAL